MQKSTSLIFICLCLIFIACQTQPNVDIENSNLKTEQEKDSLERIESVPTTHNSIQGEWILTDFVDSVITKKSIYGVTRTGLSWSAIYLSIKNDSIFYNGTIYQELKKIKSLEKNKLSISSSGNYYDLMYDSINDLILAKNVKGRFKQKEDFTFIYRRVQPDEDYLIDGVKNSKLYFKLQSNCYPYFINKLFTGKYRRIDNNKSFELKENGILIGFNAFNQYRVHSYFGTLHPYIPEDAIIFENLNKPSYSIRGEFLISMFTAGNLEATR